MRIEDLKATADVEKSMIIGNLLVAIGSKPRQIGFVSLDLQGETILQACFIAEPAGLTHKERYVNGRPFHKIWTPTFVCQTTYLGRPFTTRRRQDEKSHRYFSS